MKLNREFVVRFIVELFGSSEREENERKSVNFGAEQPLVQTRVEANVLEEPGDAAASDQTCFVVNERQKTWEKASFGFRHEAPECWRLTQVAEHGREIIQVLLLFVEADLGEYCNKSVEDVFVDFQNVLHGDVNKRLRSSDVGQNRQQRISELRFRVKDAFENDLKQPDAFVSCWT